MKDTDEKIANQLIFGILCYTYQNLRDEVQNQINRNAMIQSREIFDMPARFIQYPMENNAIRTKERVITCALCPDLNEFLHDPEAMPGEIELKTELREIFKKIEPGLNLEILLINGNITHIPETDDITRRSAQEKLNAIVQDLKNTNFGQINDKTKRQFIFGVICYVYHQFDQEARNLFVNDSIIIDEKI